MKNKPMTVKQMIQAIREMLASGDEEAHKLWKILTALRGPDEGGTEGETYNLKMATTAVIRRRFLGRMSDWLGSRFGVDVGKDNPDCVKLRNRAENHFLIHAESAFKALGLKWHKDNDAPKPKKARNRTQSQK